MSDQDTPPTYDTHLMMQAEMKATGAIVHDFNRLRANYWYAAKGEYEHADKPEACEKFQRIRVKEEARLRAFVLTGQIPKYER